VYRIDLRRQKLLAVRRQRLVRSLIHRGEHLQHPRGLRGDVLRQRRRVSHRFERRIERGVHPDAVCKDPAA
jgi:hypothetical protein